jgi:hypothetical protein
MLGCCRYWSWSGMAMVQGKYHAIPWSNWLEMQGYLCHVLRRVYNYRTIGIEGNASHAEGAARRVQVASGKRSKSKAKSAGSTVPCNATSTSTTMATATAPHASTAQHDRGLEIVNCFLDFYDPNVASKFQDIVSAALV